MWTLIVYVMLCSWKCCTISLVKAKVKGTFINVDICYDSCCIVVYLLWIRESIHLKVMSHYLSSLEQPSWPLLHLHPFASSSTSNGLHSCLYSSSHNQPLILLPVRTANLVMGQLHAAIWCDEAHCLMHYESRICFIIQAQSKDWLISLLIRVMLVRVSFTLAFSVPMLL